MVDITKTGDLISFLCPIEAKHFRNTLRSSGKLAFEVDRFDGKERFLLETLYESAMIAVDSAPEIVCRFVDECFQIVIDYLDLHFSASIDVESVISPLACSLLLRREFQARAKISNRCLARCIDNNNASPKLDPSFVLGVTRFLVSGDDARCSLEKAVNLGHWDEERFSTFPVHPFLPLDEGTSTHKGIFEVYTHWRAVCGRIDEDQTVSEVSRHFTSYGLE